MNVSTINYEGPEQVCEGFASHFRNLGEPKQSETFYEDHRIKVEADTAVIHELHNTFPGQPTTITTEEVRGAIAPGGYSTLGWVRMCGPKFRPPPYNKTRKDANLQAITKPFAS